jgi:cell division ATPase FtsA
LSSVPVSKDDSYTEAERKQGILRWDVQVAAGANGTKATAVEHKYRIEHDRQLTIGGMASR